MRSGKIMMFGILASALLGGACNRADEPRNDSAVREEANSAEVEAKRQQERNEEIARLDNRVAEIERKYAEANQKVVTEKKTPTAGLREELKEDVSNVKLAVNDLKTTTPDNWWERHEQALNRVADDVEADVVAAGGQAQRGSTVDDDRRCWRESQHRAVHLAARRIRRQAACAHRCA